jgi:hypothetical protein
MTTSGSYDFTRTRNQIIMRAGRLTGAIRAGSTMKAQDVSDFAEALNSMVKRWSVTPGMHVWTTAEGTLFPQASQSKYALGSSSTDHATETFYETEISTGGEASGQTTLSVEATTNMTVGDYIGVVVDDGTLHWSTIASKTSSTVTINDALDDDASAGNKVFNYTTKLIRPLKIPNKEGAVRLYNLSSGNDSSLGPPISRDDYYLLPNKTQTGTINQVFYDPQLTLGYIYLWSPPSSVTDLVKFTWHRPIQDFDAAGDNPDLPVEWIDAMVYNLALLMAPEYDTPRDKMEGAFGIGAMAVKYLDDVAGFDREAESVFFQPDHGC